VTGLLDTSVVVRYLTGEPPHLAVQSASLIESDTPLLLPEVVIAEAAHVLVSRYRFGREAVVDALVGLVRRPNIRPLTLATESALAALLIARPSGRVSIPDALVWAHARESDSPVVYTFDRRFPADGIELREAP
jgi:predicted nucleic acid-binding protein